MVIAGVVGDEATDVLIDFDSFSFATSPSTAVDEEQRVSDVPSAFALNDAFPNPFNSNLGAMVKSTPTRNRELAIICPASIVLRCLRSARGQDTMDT